jgi:hypothetical protein
MSEIRTTITVEILDNLQQPVGTYSRTLTRSQMDNPRFFGGYASDAAVCATADVRAAIEAVHGVASL